MRIIFLTIYFILGMCIYKSNAQSIELIADLYSTYSNETPSEEALQDLFSFFEKPINLNTIQEEDCKKFIFLSTFEQQSLWYFIDKNRPLQSIYEIQFVLGLPKEKIVILEKFCIVEPLQNSKTFSEKLQKGRHEFSVTNSIPMVSFEEYMATNKYAGSPFKQCFRYRYNAFNSLLWGFTGKKDAGEQFPFSSTQVYDFRSAYFQYKTEGLISNLVVGNYKIQIGQGLVAWQGGFFNSCIDKIDSKTVCSINKHSSSNESDYLQGISGTVSFNKIRISPFISHRKIDGKLNQDSTENLFNLYETGYHRTASEIANRQTTIHLLKGINASFKYNKIQFGATGIHQKILKDTSTYEITTGSISYIIARNKTKFFGEIASNSLKKTALIIGIHTNKISDLEYTMSFRYYNPEFTGTVSCGFDENNSPQNETGIFTIWNLRISRYLQLQSTQDVFVAPNSSNYLYTSGYSSKQTYKIVCTPLQNYTICYTYSYTSVTKPTFTEQTYQSAQQIKHFHKILCSFPISEQVYSNTGILFSNVFHTIKEEGSLVYQDVIWKKQDKLSLLLRYAMFNAPYNARIYASEQNLSYMFSLSQYYKTGNQLYLIVKSQITNSIDLQIKYYVTDYYISTNCETDEKERGFDVMVKIHF